MFVRIVLASALTASAAIASPVPDRAALKQYCTGDYLNYCSDFSPDSPEMHSCFKQNKTKLSANCQTAISTYVKAQKRS